MTLEWRTTGAHGSSLNFILGYSGQICIAEVRPDDKLGWLWEMRHLDGVLQSFGSESTAAAAQDSAEHHWKRWLRYANLRPIKES